jgi:hypothetical protein
LVQEELNLLGVACFRGLKDRSVARPAAARQAHRERRSQSESESDFYRGAAQSAVHRNL